MIVVKCECGKEHKLDRSLVGRRVQCPKCDAVFRVSDSEVARSDSSNESSTSEPPLLPPSIPKNDAIETPKIKVSGISTARENPSIEQNSSKGNEPRTNKKNSPSSSSNDKKSGILVYAWVGVGLFGIVASVLIYWVSSSNAKARIEHANNEVEKAIQQAEDWLSTNVLEGNSEVVAALQKAQQIEHASNKEFASATLKDVERQVDQLSATRDFENALSVLEKDQIDNAKRALTRLSEKNFPQAKQAKKIVAEIEKASSKKNALEFLSALSDQEFQKVNSTRKVNGELFKNKAIQKLWTQNIIDNLTSANNKRKQLKLAQEAEAKQKALRERQAKKDNAVRNGIVVIPEFLQDWDQGELLSKFAFSPNGRLLAVAEKNGKCSVYDFVNKKFVSSFEASIGILDKIFQFSACSKYFVCANSNGFSILDLNANKINTLAMKDYANRVFPFESFRPVVKGERTQKLQLSNDSIFAVTEKSIYQGTIGLYPKFKRQFISGHNQSAKINDFKISRDGQIAVSCGTDRIAVLYDTASGKEIGIADFHAKEVIACSLSGDGRRLLTSGREGLLASWNTTTGKPDCIWKFNGKKNSTDFDSMVSKLRSDAAVADVEGIVRDSSVWKNHANKLRAEARSLESVYGESCANLISVSNDGKLAYVHAFVTMGGSLSFPYQTRHFFIDLVDFKLIPIVVANDIIYQVPLNGYWTKGAFRYLTFCPANKILYGFIATKYRERGEEKVKRSFVEWTYEQSIID